MYIYIHYTEDKIFFCCQYCYIYYTVGSALQSVKNLQTRVLLWIKHCISMEVKVWQSNAEIVIVTAHTLSQSDNLQFLTCVAIKLQ